MVTAQSSVEKYQEFLSCSICYGTFKVPKTLPCLHSFCEKCLSDYILSAVEIEKKNGFECPLCQHYVDITSEFPETWSDLLPKNQFLISLLERQALSNPNKACDACAYKKAPQQRATVVCCDCKESYCGSCVLSHKSFKMTSTHKLNDIHEIGEHTDIMSTLLCVL